MGRAQRAGESIRTAYRPNAHRGTARTPRDAESRVLHRDKSASRRKQQPRPTIDVHEPSSGSRRQNDQLDGRRCNWRSRIRGRPCRRSDASGRCAEGAFDVDVASLFGRGRASAGPRTMLSAPPSCRPRPRFARATWRSTLAGKKKTTFAKLNREAKVREKRQASSMRKEQRQRERDAGVQIEDQVEDLSHLDVAVVAGVEPDVTVKR